MELKKRKEHAFGKDIYLIGSEEGGALLWLEAPSWDCNRYWGFGYIETYTNNDNPGSSRDIQSHEHVKGFFGNQEKYDYDKQCFVSAGRVSNLIDNPRLHKTTFNKSESWQLTELFKQFYLLKEMAEFSEKTLPGCQIMESPVNHGNLKRIADEINKTMIPKITAKIIDILCPVSLKVKA